MRRLDKPPLFLRFAYLDEMTIGIAHIAPCLGLVDLRLSEELRPQSLPTFVAFRDVRDAEVQEATDSLAVARQREIYGRLVTSRPAGHVDNDLSVRELHDVRLPVSIL